MKKVDFYIFCLTFFTLSFGVAAMAALVPSIAQDFNVSGVLAIRLTWLYMLPYGLFAVLWSPLTRIVKVKRLFTVAIAGFFLSALMFSLSQTIGGAFIFRFLMGCCGCSFIPLSLISIAKTVEDKEKGRYIGVFFTLSYLAAMLSVFLSGFVYWRLLYFAQACLVLVLLVLVLFHMEDFDFRNDRRSISYWKTLKNEQSWKFFLVVAFGSFLYHAIWQRFGLFLSEDFGLTQGMIGVVFTVAAIAAVIFEFTGGLLTRNLKSGVLIRYGFFLMGTVFLLILLKNVYLIFFVVFVWAGAWSLSHVGLSAYLTKFPDNLLRDSASLNSALRFSFGGLGAFLGGFLVSCFDFRSLVLVCCIGLILLGYFSDKLILEGE